MLQLPRNCSCSELKVNPSNWTSPKASIKKNWFIFYRFYDLTMREQMPKGKLVIIKGMNGCKTLAERQEATSQLIKMEMEQLQRRGFNPITKQFLPVTAAEQVGPDTPFLEALERAYAGKSFASDMKKDLKSVLKYLTQAIFRLQMESLPLKEIRRRHIKLILEQCKHEKEIWTANTFNFYRSHFSILFNELLELDAIDINPVKDIKKMKTIRSIRKVLTQEQRAQIDSFLKNHDERLWRFIHIFFHSGSRTTEILRVQGQHVDLKNQKVRYLVLKGQQGEWVERTIKTIALPYWQNAMEGCSPLDYVFSRGLRPGTSFIRREQISKRWKKHIKEKLGIDCDFYSLKHLNTDQTAEMMGLEIAAAQNSHKSIEITKIYAVGEKERVHNRLKRVDNPFA